jgi:hypothetical protein
MSLSITELLIIIAVSFSTLGAFLFMTLSRGKTLYPVYCADCWVHRAEETIVARSESKHQWAICPKCTNRYWQFKSNVS